MNVLLALLWSMLKIGCFAFGGAYAAIPLIRDVVLSYGWLTDETLSYMIAVSESTPGPIMVNLATYVGSSQAGFFGSLLATLAVVLPSFIVTILVTVVLKNLLKNKYARAILDGLKACVVGIILGTGAYMTICGIVPSVGSSADIRALIITGILAAVMFLSKPVLKKKLSPIVLIAVSAVLGIVVYGI